MAHFFTKKLRFNCLQHVNFEGPGVIADWITANGHELTFTHLYAGDQLPTISDFDILVVMGGPMSYDDDDKYEWMAKEKAFLKEAILAGKKAIGICLGAQLLSIAAGADGKHGTAQEVGWFPINFCNQENTFAFLPGQQTVFQWHGDTFTLPEGAKHFAGTELFPSQGFILNNKIIGLQFHLEVNQESVLEMVKNVGHTIPVEPFTQSPRDIREETRFYNAGNKLMFAILDQLTNTED